MQVLSFLGFPQVKLANSLQLPENFAIMQWEVQALGLFIFDVKFCTLPFQSLVIFMKIHLYNENSVCIFVSCSRRGFLFWHRKSQCLVLLAGHGLLDLPFMFDALLVYAICGFHLFVGSSSFFWGCFLVSSLVKQGGWDCLTFLTSKSSKLNWG